MAGILVVSLKQSYDILIQYKVLFPHVYTLHICISALAWDGERIYVHVRVKLGVQKMSSESQIVGDARSLE